MDSRHKDVLKGLGDPITRSMTKKAQEILNKKINYFL